MQLRNASGAPSVATEQVASIEHAERNKHSLSEWVKQAAAMAATRPPETVSYTAGPMPELEDLMEQWPPEIEAALEHVQLTRKTLDSVDIKSLIRIYCALLDIPVYGDNLVEPLHQMLSLCLELKARAAPLRALLRESRLASALPRSQLAGTSVARLADRSH